MKHLLQLTSLISILLLSAVAATAQTWAVAVNTADAMELGTLGVEGSAAVGQHWSIHAGAKVYWLQTGRSTAAVVSSKGPGQ